MVGTTLREVPKTKTCQMIPYVEAILHMYFLQDFACFLKKDVSQKILENFGFGGRALREKLITPFCHVCFEV